MARMEKEKSDEGNPYLPRKVMEVMSSPWWTISTCDYCLAICWRLQIDCQQEMVDQGHPCIVVDDGVEKS